jgi:lipopolysaccharide/colanic/teichoic acid biosynthesis glycosyltransferase
MIYKRFFKRLIDFFASFFGILLISPLLLLLILLLTIANRGKVFFTQARPGKDEKIFRVIKFKTMNDRRDKSGKLLPDKERLTPIGKLIRSTSMDELPQLINVLKGDMSLVGPRPLLVSYLPLYNEFQKRRHEVRPGITGWTQVNGRNSLSWDEKFKLDVWYVDNISFMLDLKILWLTFVKVLKREGVNAADATTMKPFKGND